MTLRTSWVRSGDISGTDFPLNNLPYGVFSVEGQAPLCGVAIGEMILDVGRVDHGQSAALFAAPEWNAVMEGRRTVWAALRTRLTDLPSEEAHWAAAEPHLGQQADAMLLVPLRFAEYTDFCSSKHHAFNVGSMFRGPENALPPNWLSIPVGYNGRASSEVVLN
jgi:fumarylacetoacetase